MKSKRDNMRLVTERKTNMADTKPAPITPLKQLYFFPDYQMSVEAESPEAALELIKQKLKDIK